ncbi:MAG: DUF1989 domain-containing protein [bacterium]
MSRTSGGGATREIFVPAASARAFEAKAGEYITIVDVEGQQVGDFVAVSAADHREQLSPAYTRSMLNRIYLRSDDQLYSNLRRPLLTIVHDDIGRHDMLRPACDATRYELQFGIRDHRNCLDNLTGALVPYGLDRWTVPEPFNISQNTRVDEDGNFVALPPLSKAGDRIVLRAAVDLIGALAACAQDQIAVNGFKLTPLRIMMGPAQ